MASLSNLASSRAPTESSNQARYDTKSWSILAIRSITGYVKEQHSGARVLLHLHSWPKILIHFPFAPLFLLTLLETIADGKECNDERVRLCVGGGHKAQGY
jgi:hypothetical protein